MAKVRCKEISKEEGENTEEHIPDRQGKAQRGGESRGWMSFWINIPV